MKNFSSLKIKLPSISPKKSPKRSFQFPTAGTWKNLNRDAIIMYIKFVTTKHMIIWLKSKPSFSNYSFATRRNKKKCARQVNYLKNECLKFFILDGAPLIGIWEAFWIELNFMIYLDSNFRTQYSL